ncbi:MAG: aminotransferase class I/II-fold pyridoxal phosphate-dependent enzyme [Lachnospiraceae bacterium]|nr:aminotransferase class I/II-fold pyridoxal phosphate-dependent enzyme [Lachnospiraceae bacterium]
MKNKKIYLSSPTMHGEELKYVQEAFDTNWVAPLGPNVNSFEREFADYVGIGYAAALSAGTAAIHLALILAGVKKGDKVFCSDLTFSATANPITYIGAEPIFIDSERDTWNMSPEALEKAFKKYPDVKYVMVVNLYGTPAKLDEIMDLCDRYHATLIEDAAESLGAVYKGKQTGCFGKIAAFSFNGNKIITTSGGGMLVSEEEEIVNKARFLSTQAREPERHYEHKEIGYNYRMSNVIAGIGRGQLLHLDEHIALKKKIYENYQENFKDITSVSMNPFDEKNSKPNYWLSCILLDKGSEVKPLDIMLALEKENIESRPIWKPMHLQPVFKTCDFVTTEASGSVGEDIFNRGVCLPSDIKNTEEDMDKIIAIVKSLF